MFMRRNRLFSLLAALTLLLSACQPTPEVEPVAQKDSEALIERGGGRRRGRCRHGQGAGIAAHHARTHGGLAKDGH